VRFASYVRGVPSLFLDEMTLFLDDPPHPPAIFRWISAIFRRNGGLIFGRIFR
jgi:hypothetical protein